MRWVRRGVAAAGMWLLALTPAGAASLEAFLADVAPAYDSIRKAIFYLQRGAAQPAAFEIESAAEAWRARVLPHAEAPPGAFADDPAFAQTLGAIVATLEKAARHESAEAALEEVRDLPARLAALRARNHLSVFADDVQEANRAMDRLWAYRHRDIDFADQGMVDELRARLAVTAYTYRNCDAAAPTPVAQDPRFRRIVDGTLASLAQMWGAIAAGDVQRVINILREVRSFDRLLWLHYG